MVASLVPRTGGSPIFLDKPIVLIGRHQDCDAVIQSSTKVSRRHCCVARVNESFVIRDLGSMNGIRVNGARVIEMLLKAGDEVAIGDQFFVLNLPEVAVAKDAGRKRSNGHAARPAPPPRNPADLSMEFPVAIPDEAYPDEQDDDLRSPGDAPVFKEPLDDVQLKEPSGSGFDYVLRS